MTILLLVLLVATCASWFLSMVVAGGKIGDLQRELSEARALAASDAGRAQLVEAQLAEVKQNYAVLLWLHDGTTMLEQAAAWTSGMHLAVRRP